MDIFTIIIIAIGLSMDCYAVSIAQGLAVQTTERPKPILMAVLFGLFQGGMPLIGYFAGNLFADFFRIYAPWIALALLAFIGGKMIWESLHEKDEEASGWQIKRLIVLAVATSIDALATGVIFIPVPREYGSVSALSVLSVSFSLSEDTIPASVWARGLRLT